jgi:NADPH-dependent 2,4-dienoyl-CoA reductase/sulfur reductase-like enzyme/nitrite reductase/ring-hydroxylating ferredoxin subunit
VRSYTDDLSKGTVLVYAFIQQHCSPRYTFMYIYYSEEKTMAEHKVGSASTFLQDGEMTRLELEGKPVVVARVEGEYYAFGGNCPHYGAPLNNGVLKGHELMCPWHHACFDVRSAVRLEPPTLNDLARFPVRVEGGEILVTLPHDNVREPQGKVDPADGRTFAIIGGGAAGESAAEELRRQGYRGRIVILSSVPETPVDRPNLSKDYLAGKAQADWIPLRGSNWYAERDIELMLNTQVTGINPKARTVQTSDGETFSYHKLLLATGGTPRTLSNVPGFDAAGVFLLRSLSDANAVVAAADGGKRAVVVGASFIGLEVAASLRARNVEVTVIAPESVPFEQVFGAAVGEMFRRAHEENGVEFRMNNGVRQFNTDGGRLTGAQLQSGEIVAADFAVLGVGVRPATDFLKDSGLALDEKDNSLLVNSRLQTSDPDIYAAGDIARYDDGSGNRVRIEHWRLAQQHGMIAARNMLKDGADDTSQHVPFFWTTQAGISLRYVGHAEKFDDVVFRGKAVDRDFIAFYVQDGKLQAAAGVKHDLEMDALEFILRDGLPLTVEQMADKNFDLVAHALGKNRAELQRQEGDK